MLGKSERFSVISARSSAYRPILESPHHFCHRTIQPRTNTQQGNAVTFLRRPSSLSLLSTIGTEAGPMLPVLTENGHHLGRINAE